MDRPSKLFPILLAVFLGMCGGSTAAEDLQAVGTIHGDRPGGQISRHIYGHFMEHLGRCIYDGVWVGEDSSIPNTRGIRNDVIEALKNVSCPNLRWPGGCFADDYHWRDGVGPRDKRPQTVNMHWGQVIETNAFGTHEFLDLCELVGAEPYLAGNVGSGSPQEMRDWIEYLTFDGASTLANLRRANGREKPWKITYFGVGNENWGCGGNMTPAFYAYLFKQFATYCPDLSGNKLVRVACGPNGGDPAWTDAVTLRAGRHMQAISLHYYTLAAPWSDKLPATGFDEEQWFGILRETLKMDEILEANDSILTGYDSARKIPLFVDEWGTWYKNEPNTNPAFLYQQNTMRDALVAVLNFHIFHKHHERVKLANIAQMVNVLQAMILTEGEKMILTPTYYAFEMCKVHQDTTYLPVEIETSAYKYGDQEIPAASISASQAADGVVSISLVNTSANDAVRVQCELQGIEATKMTGRVLTAAALDAHNTFDKPEQVKPTEFKNAAIQSGTLKAVLPPHSVVVLSLSK